MDIVSFLFFSFIALILGTAFLAPSIIAYKMGKRGLIFGIVIACNILIGWTGFGWIIAMLLAIDRR